MIDVNQFREQQLQLINNADKEYIFYYDETNNIRKLYLTKDGLNTPECRNFILGGIVHKKGMSFDFELLINDLNLQKTTNEIKLKHIGKGNFLNILNSKKG